MTKPTASTASTAPAPVRCSACGAKLRAPGASHARPTGGLCTAPRPALAAALASTPTPKVTVTSAPKPAPKPAQAPAPKQAPAKAPTPKPTPAPHVDPTPTLPPGSPAWKQAVAEAARQAADLDDADLDDDAPALTVAQLRDVLRSPGARDVLRPVLLELLGITAPPLPAPAPVKAPEPAAPVVTVKAAPAPTPAPVKAQAAKGKGKGKGKKGAPAAPAPRPTPADGCQTCRDLHGLLAEAERTVESLQGDLKDAETRAVKAEEEQYAAEAKQEEAEAKAEEAEAGAAEDVATLVRWALAAGADVADVISRVSGDVGNVVRQADASVLR